MKVSELSGAELDYWVAKAEGLPAKLESLMINPLKPSGCWLFFDNLPQFSRGPYNPSTNWTIAGPIIEREKIALDYYGDSKRWCANNSFFAETPLIAAMRAFVASRFGEEV